MKLSNGEQKRRLTSIVENLLIGLALHKNLDDIFVAVERGQMKRRKAVVLLYVDELRRIRDELLSSPNQLYISY